MKRISVVDDEQDITTVLKRGLLRRVQIFLTIDVRAFIRKPVGISSLVNQVKTTIES